jgi:hypothetical protein
MPSTRPLVLACLLAVSASTAHALLTRADRDDDEYVELASKYDSSVSLGAGLGEGVLVAPRWILTAAHRATVLKDLGARPALRIGDASYEIDAVVTHPEWKGGRDNDVALIRLARAVGGVQPTPIHRATDESGKGIVVVAHGPSGKLASSAANGPRRKRAAINTVGDLGPRLFTVTIKAGDDASDLQGAALREETGAPGYIDGEDGMSVGGVLVAVEEPRADAASGSVGEKEIFARASNYAAWIDSVTSALR